MGAIILIVTALIEIAFASYCVATKSSQPRIRNWVRLGAGVSFLLLTAVSVIEWSFRWYLIALILGLWALTAGVALLRNRAVENQAFKARRVILKGIASWLLLLVAALPLLAFPQYKLPAPTGTHQVERTTHTYTDESRLDPFAPNGAQRQVTIEFWYPADPGAQYPLVLFDHGAFGMNSSNGSTFAELASHGYVVGSIDHPYHSLYTKSTEGQSTIVNQAFLKEVQDVNAGLYDAESAYALEQNWLKLRTADISFVLNTLLPQAGTKGEKLYEMIDAEKIGLIGHSLGGAASVQLGRERQEIDAVINLDGDLLGEYLGVKDGKPVINHERYPVPLLNIWTDDMKRAMESVQEPSIELPMKHILATAPQAYETYISGTNHMSLTDLPLISPFAVKLIGGSFAKAGAESSADSAYVIKTMNQLVLSFFDANLKGSSTFQAAATY